MLKKKRQKHILEQIRIYNQVKSSELSEQLGVSEDTIRRDIKELSDGHRILKVHGGAMSENGYLPFNHQDREIYAHDEKVIIVKKAMSLVQNNQVILMDGGTTNLEFVRLLPEDLRLTVFTTSIPVALNLTQQPNVETYFIGGKVLDNAQVTIGIDVIESLKGIKADLCFIGTRSMDLKLGISDFNRDEVQVKRALVAAAYKTVSLCISEKLGTIQPYVVASPDKLDILVTELDPGSKTLCHYARLGITII